MVSFYRIFKTFYSRGRGRHHSSCLVNVGCENSCFYRFRKWFRNFKTIDSEQARYENAQVTSVSLCKVYWGLLIALYTLYTLTHFTDTFFIVFLIFCKEMYIFRHLNCLLSGIQENLKDFIPYWRGVTLFTLCLCEKTLWQKEISFRVVYTAKIPI